MATEVPSLFCDLNGQEKRADGEWVVVVITDETLQLRQDVVLMDHDIRCSGIVSGFKDHGRGEFYEVEVGHVIS